MRLDGASTVRMTADRSGPRRSASDASGVRHADLGAPERDVGSAQDVERGCSAQASSSAKSRYHRAMRHACALLLALSFAAPAFAQARKPAPGTKKPTAPPTATRKEAPDVTCPNDLGVGVKTKLRFCDVMTGRDPAGGIVIKLPPHKGAVTLTFDLHNRQTYSEEQVRAKKAYARYTATVGVL